MGYVVRGDNYPQHTGPLYYGPNLMLGYFLLLNLKPVPAPLAPTCHLPVSASPVAGIPGLWGCAWLYRIMQWCCVTHEAVLNEQYNPLPFRSGQSGLGTGFQFELYNLTIWVTFRVQSPRASFEKKNGNIYDTIFAQGMVTWAPKWGPQTIFLSIPNPW